MGGKAFQRRRCSTPPADSRGILYNKILYDAIPHRPPVRADPYSVHAIRCSRSVSNNDAGGRQREAN